MFAESVYRRYDHAAKTRYLTYNQIRLWFKMGYTLLVSKAVFMARM